MHLPPQWLVNVRERLCLAYLDAILMLISRGDAGSHIEIEISARATDEKDSIGAPSLP